MPYGEGWTFGCAGQEEDLRRGLEKQRLLVWGLAETENVLEKRRPIQWGRGCLEQKFLTFTRDSLENLIKNPPPNANITYKHKKVPYSYRRFPEISVDTSSKQLNTGAIPVT